MHKRYFVATYRLLLGLLVVAALVTQFTDGLSRPGFSLANFFSFFTIQSNVLASIILLVSAWGALNKKRNEKFALLRGAGTLYIATTGVVYALLLSGLETSLQTPIPWVNIVLHYITPIVVVFDWFFDLPPFRIAFKKALLWLAFPLLYLAYSLIRGAVTGWYPYPFLNPANHGYEGVLLICLVIAMAIAAFARLLSQTTLLKKKPRR